MFRASPALAPDLGISIEGSKLVVPDGYVFPPLCPLTGEATGLDRAETRRVSSHDAWIYLLLLAGVLPYVLVAVLASRKGSFVCRLSPRMTRRWRAYRKLGGLAFFGSFVCFGYAISRHSIALSGLSLVMLIGGFTVAMGLLDGIAAARVADGRIWLCGIPRRVMQQILAIERRRMHAALTAAAAAKSPEATAVPGSSPPELPPLPPFVHKVE